MIHYLFKKVRSGTKSRTWYGRYKYDWMPCYKEVSLGVTDKQVADVKLREIEKEAEREYHGLGSSKAVRDSAKVDIASHLEDFLKNRAMLGRAPGHICNLKNYITTICNSCKWKYLQDIKADDFEHWRGMQKLSGKTLNDYLAGFNSFIRWLSGIGRIKENPLQAIKRIDLRGKKQIFRRALSPDESMKLLAVASPVTRAAYMLALYCGMRRGELKNLQWSDLTLSGKKPSVFLRASITKNRKDKDLPLRGEVIAALQAIRPADVSGKVFPSFPRICRMRKDWLAAKIATVDASGKHADFHSLRKTFCTMMANAGVAPRIAQEAMRHSDPHLTAQVYTDSCQLDLRAAVDALPSLWNDEQKAELKKGAQIGAQISVQNGLLLSSSVMSKSENKKLQAVDYVSISHDLSQVVKAGEMVGVTGLEPVTSTMST